MPAAKKTIAPKLEAVRAPGEDTEADDDLIGDVPATAGPVMLKLDLDGEHAEFKTSGKVPQWMFLKLAWAQKVGGEQDTLAVLYEMFTKVVDPAEFGKLEAYMGEHAFEYGDLFESLGNVVQEMANVPLAVSSRSSDSSTPTAT